MSYDDILYAAIRKAWEIGIEVGTKDDPLAVILRALLDEAIAQRQAHADYPMTQDKIAVEALTAALNTYRAGSAS